MTGARVAPPTSPVLDTRGGRLASGLASIALAVAGWLALAAVERGRDAVGAGVFDGRVPLVARVDGHDEPLPPSAAACANCHLPQAAPARADGTGPAPVAYGPALRRASLTEPAARRGGPPSRFDRGSFCRLLRTGEDPAGVLLPRAMPRYDVDDATCARLWAWLVRAGS